MKKVYVIVLGLMLTTQVVSARNNAALFGVAAAAIAGAAILANSQSASRHHYAPRHHYTPRRKKHHAHHKTHVVISDEMKIQISLKNMDFYHGAIDGKINSYATRTAIKKMNKEYGLDNDTSLDQRTWDQLLYLSQLYQMDKDLFADGNSQITKGKRLQTALKVFGAYDGKVDGVVGSGTRRAIAVYKREKRLGASSHLTSNERYNLIDSAQKMNSQAIDEAIESLYKKDKRAKRRTRRDNEESNRDVSTKRTTRSRVSDREESQGTKDDDSDEMQKALDSIDDEKVK